MSEQRPPEGPVTRPGDPVESHAVPMRQRNYRLPDSLITAVEVAARERGISEAEFVREALAFRLGVLQLMDHGTETVELEALLRKVLERPSA